ncbi:hypothetical protein AB0I82_30495 [Streptomyces sp. NPDC050315]|uniref:hypothetical protein n=1 Tax=Streptomyces sp. NPDC050315 TaxID=3155039 RepID=UPI00343DB778
MDQAQNEARLRYISERPVFETLASNVANLIRTEVAANGITCEVHGRSKDVASFVRKALQKRYSDPWAEITDKAGDRVILEHSNDIDDALEVIRSAFTIIREEDERDEPDNEKKLVYPKIHLQIADPGHDPTSEMPALECEIQVRTRAQDLWSRMSHALLYKPAVPASPVVRRSLYRLLALVELYDSEVARGVEEMESNPDFREVQLLRHAERVFHLFVASSYDISISEEILPVLTPLIVDTESYGHKLVDFSRHRFTKLDDTFREYGPMSEVGQSGQYILIGQPESVIIFQLLEEMPLRLAAAWREALPEDWLEELSNVWGVAFE